MNYQKVEPKYNSKPNPRIGLITLASDFRIEKDFNHVIHNKDIDLFSNRIHCYNPLTNETLKKMADDITDVTKEILPDQKLDCVAYGCTSGSIAAGYESIFEKINKAKPNTKVTTPITAAIKSLNKLGLKKISIFTPYTSEINKSVEDYFLKEKFEISELTYFDIASDLDIGKVDQDHLYDVLKNIDLSNSDALFVSCTALPVLTLIDDLEKKINKPVLSSNQVLIWDSLRQIGFNSEIKGFGEIFKN